MSVPFRIAVFASGNGSNLAALLERFPPGASPEVALVLSDRESAHALERARAAGVPALVIQPGRFASEEEFGNELVRLLRDLAVDLVVLAGYLRKIPRNLLDAFPGRVVNVHPALLPRFGGPGMYGARVHAAVLSAGERESGATVHFVDAEFDTGPVIAQARVPVQPADTSETLAARVLEAEHELLPRVVDLLARGKVRWDQGRGVVHDDPDHGAPVCRTSMRRGRQDESDVRGS
ncbi:MAG: phosphoribosylglycinamide formyltransferase [Gemmatimonadetes bacterium]|nr:phosphoribosylglycinamide formyltransferase [Gemmatimonadota bacterium]